MHLDPQYDNANHATVLLDSQQEAPSLIRSQIKVKMGGKYPHETYHIFWSWFLMLSLVYYISGVRWDKINTITNKPYVCYCILLLECCLFFSTIIILVLLSYTNKIIQVCMSFANKIFIFARYIIGQKKENNDIPKSGSTTLMETKKNKTNELPWSWCYNSHLCALFVKS